MCVFINVKWGERSGFIITELLSSKEQKFLNGFKIIHRNLRLNEFGHALMVISYFDVIVCF